MNDMIIDYKVIDNKMYIVDKHIAHAVKNITGNDTINIIDKVNFFVLGIVFNKIA